MGLDYSGYGYDHLGSSLDSTASAGVGVMVWLIISLIAALVGCFLVYFMFVKKDDKLKNEKLEWLRSFLRFDKMLIEPVMKILYIFAAILLTLGSFAMLAMGFAGFLMCVLTILFGNLFLRMAYEGIMIRIMIWKNTAEIKKEIKK